MKLVLTSLISFFKDNGPLYAGSIAYFFLMSFVPFFIITLIAVLISISTSWKSKEQSQKYVVNFVFFFLLKKARNDLST